MIHSTNQHILIANRMQIIMNDININETLGLISQQLRNRIGQWLSEGSG